MFNEDVRVRARETLCSRSRAFLIAVRRHLFPPLALIATPVDAEPTCRRIENCESVFQLDAYQSKWPLSDAKTAAHVRPFYL